MAAEKTEMAGVLTLLSRRHIASTVIVVIVAIFLFLLTVEMLGYWTLGDFTVTFYRSANYMLRGENVYINAYPHPTNGREYPPFNPIWILYSVVPIGVFPLRLAEALRFLLDVGAVFMLAYISARWAGFTKWWMMVLLALAPWHFIMIYSGQWPAITLLGTFLCYWGVKSSNPFEMSVGMWLALAKPNVTVLIILAVLLFAWQSRTLVKTLAIFILLIVVSSISQPSWIFDLGGLYVDRILHPRLADSVLLFPGYPWGQIVLLSAGAISLIIYILKFREPTPWLWAALTSISLVGALHTFTYDWFMLMLPLAWLLRQLRSLYLIAFIYAYPFLWSALGLMGGFHLPSPVILPATVMLAVFVWRTRQAILPRGTW